MIGYLDLPAGISGDMFLGCLVDAGWPIDELRATLSKLKLPAEDWSVAAIHVMKGPLRATLVDVTVTEGHAHGHSHGDGHHHHHDHHQHAHRNLQDIRGIIRAADLPEAVKQRSIAVFTRLAHAEAKVHGTSVDDIHFHEVGALDAIVDIVGTVAGLHALGVEQLHANPLPAGGGLTNCDHRTNPAPAPPTDGPLAAGGPTAMPGVTPPEKPPCRFSRTGRQVNSRSVTRSSLGRW